MKRSTVLSLPLKLVFPGYRQKIDETEYGPTFPPLLKVIKTAHNKTYQITLFITVVEAGSNSHNERY